MQRKSWIILAACIGVMTFLLLSYFVSQSRPEPLTQAQAVQALDAMQKAVTDKNVDGVMQYVAPGPDTKLAGASPDHVRRELMAYFHNADTIHAEFSNVAFTGGEEEAILEFDLVVTEGSQFSGEDYKGHITLHLRRVDVPRLFGLLQAKEWRIVQADTTGPKPNEFGDF